MPAIRNALPALVLFFALFAPAVSAQTFQVAVVPETDHPDPGAHFEVYEIDGTQGASLTLERGETYTFQMNGVPTIHPFHISTSSTGGDGGANTWTEGVTNNGATGNETLIFEVPQTAPDLLYYQCENHLVMGWELNIVNPVSVEDEAPRTDFSISLAYPNPSNDVVSVGIVVEQTRNILVEVFDVSGRRVAVLHEGPLAAGSTHEFTFGDEALPGGVYLVRATGGGSSLERRVTLVR